MEGSIIWEYVTAGASYFHDDHSHPFFSLYHFAMLIHFAHSLSVIYYLIIFISKTSWQYSLVASSFCVVSGGVVSHLVFGQAPRLFNNNFALPCTVVSWYLMNYFPKDIFFKLYHNFVPFRAGSEALHRLSQLRSLVIGIGLGRTHGSYWVGPLMGGLVAGITSSFAKEYVSGGVSPLQKPGYTFVVLSWATVIIVSDILGSYAYGIIAVYLVLVEVYFGFSGAVVPHPFPLNIFSNACTTVLQLHNRNVRVTNKKDN